MGIYDGYGDTPNQIVSEGQQINITFIRNGDGTGTIKWNIPAPVAGCSAEDQSYDGIVITVSDKPANYIASSPKNGSYYDADPTFDPDLHSGDVIDDARVVGAFYHDKTTKTLIVQNVSDKVPYYVSGYAVDEVARYHREGVHAYSIPTGTLEYNDALDQPARHDIGIDLDIIDNTTPTGLVSGTDYTFKILINGTEHEITIAGADALTYTALVDAINEEFKDITPAESRDLTENKYFFDVENNKLFQWNFDKWITLNVIVDEDDPTVPVTGTYWYDGTDLWLYESSGWVKATVFKLSFDPVNPECNTIWFDGTDVWMWEGTHWCKLNTITSTTNPLLPPELSCDNYWFDENTGILKQWSVDIDGWKDVDAIYSEIDPNIIGVGDYWYNSTSEKMSVMVASVWEELVNIVYEEKNSSGDLDTTEANQYWYVPSEQEFYRRNGSNTDWIELDFILSPTDPTVRNSCDLWWDASSSTDLYTWDEINSEWKSVSSFIQSTIDPSHPEELPEDSAWYNPDTGQILILTSPECVFKDAEIINHPTDPTMLGFGFGWINADGDIQISDGSGGWISIDPILSPTDPYNIIAGTYWYDQTNSLLNQWDGSLWTVISLETEMSVPEIGEIVLNSDDDMLYTWNGITWAPASSIASLVLINPNISTEKNRLCFITSAIGCEQSIRLIIESENLFTQLTATVMYFDPVKGSSRLEKGRSYNALGVGDDGSPDERRELNAVIRRRLGHPSQRVELTNDQIDDAIDSALKMIRKYSGYGYRRNYFFLNLKPNQQKYILTDRCVGFNKIVGINYLYRLRSGFLNGNISRGGYDIYGYAALLHLYRTGTFDMLSFHLVSSYIEDMQILFADHITFNWHETIRELHLYHAVYGEERVLVDAYTERTEQDLITDRETSEWIKKWAVAECKMMLSQVRGKFQTLPGPSGSTTLNSQELITQAEAEMMELKELLEDESMQNLEESGQGAHFIMG